MSIMVRVPSRRGHRGGDKRRPGRRKVPPRDGYIKRSVKFGAYERHWKRLEKQWEAQDAAKKAEEAAYFGDANYGADFDAVAGDG